MAVQIGGDQLSAADVTYSVTPNATYAAGQIYYLDDTISNYATGSKDIASSSRYDFEGFYGALTGWNQSAAATVVISYDCGTARGGTWWTAQGHAVIANAIDRPAAAHLEYSDNNSTWTTVNNFTGLSGAAAGNRAWVIRWDVSGAGDHRYWRVTLTHAATWIMVANMAMT